MPNPQTYVSFVPLGKVAITAAGTPSPLSQNCGPLGGRITGPSYLDPPVPGARLRQVTIQAPSTNTGALYLLPRGKTVTGNPESIMLIISIGGAATFPSGLMSESFLPENFVLDTDAVSGTQYFYGYGVIG